MEASGMAGVAVIRMGDEVKLRMESDQLVGQRDIDLKSSLWRRTMRL